MLRSVVTLIIFGLIFLAPQLLKLNFGPTVRVPHLDSPICRDPKEHVYSPDRLRLIDPCIQVTGTIEAIRSEPDGDDHVLVRLDSDFSDLINEANKKEQRGDLVVEPVCEHRVTQENAKEACVGVTSGLPLPPVGSQVSIIGPYVLDTDHGDWAEIHPAWLIDSSNNLR
jgi:hypothetical protein